MRKKLNPRYISARREYSFKEIAQIYGLHIGTVKNWQKQGLKILEGTKSPKLTLGAYLLKFLKERDRKCKKPLVEDEFYCTRCNEPRASLPEAIDYLLTKKKTGKGKKQFRIIGICEVCACPLNRFINEDKVEDFKKIYQRYAEGIED